MQRKVHISRILLVVSLMFTIVFQFAHSYTHMSKTKSYVLEHGNHNHFTEKSKVASNTFEWNENHHVLEKCFQCDVIPHVAILSEVVSWSAIDSSVLKHIQDIAIQQFTPLSHVYFSLRAPPVFV